MDIEEWNPMKDKYLDMPYNAVNVISGKAAAKEALQVGRGPTACLLAGACCSTSTGSCAACCASLLLQPDAPHCARTTAPSGSRTAPCHHC